MIAAQADAYVMHGDAPEVIAAKVADLSAPRAAAGRPPLTFGVSGYVICRDTEAAARAELDRILDVRSSPEAYASYQDFVRGLAAGIAGVAARSTASPTAGCAAA